MPTAYPGAPFTTQPQIDSFRRPYTSPQLPSETRNGDAQSDTSAPKKKRRKAESEASPAHDDEKDKDKSKAKDKDNKDKRAKTGRACDACVSSLSGLPI